MEDIRKDTFREIIESVRKVEDEYYSKYLDALADKDIGHFLIYNSKFEVCGEIIHNILDENILDEML